MCLNKSVLWWKWLNTEPRRVPVYFCVKHEKASWVMYSKVISCSPFNLAIYTNIGLWSVTVSYTVITQWQVSSVTFNSSICPLYLWALHSLFVSSSHYTLAHSPDGCPELDAVTRAPLVCPSSPNVFFSSLAEVICCDTAVFWLVFP